MLVGGYFDRPIIVISTIDRGQLWKLRTNLSLPMGSRCMSRQQAKVPLCCYVMDFPNLGIRGGINSKHWQALATVLSHLTCAAMAKPTNRKQLTNTPCFTCPVTR